MDGAEGELLAWIDELHQIEVRKLGEGQHGRVKGRDLVLGGLQDETSLLEIGIAGEGRLRAECGSQKAVGREEAAW